MSDRNVKYVEIVFENCESIQLPIERFEFIGIGNISRYLIHQSHLPLNIPGSLDYYCDFIRMDITYGSEDELRYNPYDYREPLGMFVENPVSNSVEDRPNVLGRIFNYNDITHIDFLDSEKESIMYVAVPFEDETMQDYNDLMTVDKTDWRGNRAIEIKIGRER